MKKKVVRRKKRKIRWGRVIVTAILSFTVLFFGVREVGNFLYAQKVNHDKKIALKHSKEVAHRLIYDDDTLIENGVGKRLYKFAEKRPETYFIIEEHKKYPQELLLSLSYNPELFDFVMDYPTKVDHDYQVDLSNGIASLRQFDERWGSASYGDSILAVSGCGPTALSIVASYLKNDSSITPLKVARMSEKLGFYIEGVGTDWQLMSKGAEKLGLNVHNGVVSKHAFKQAFDHHRIIIASMMPGDFTKVGHFIVLTGMKNDKVNVIDPNSSKRSKAWDYNRLSKQINNVWVYDNA